jgi:uncharacterized membrane protein
MKTTKRTRLIISLTLFVTLIIMPISAVIVHVTHGTKISHIWLHLHVVFGVIFVVAGIYHAVINWRTLKHYLTGKKQ